MIRSMLTPEMCAEVKYADMAARLEGFSGSDIRLLCREAAMWPLRRLMSKLDIVSLKQNAPEDDESLKMDPITAEDVSRALASTRRSSHIKMSKYQDWAARYG